MSRRGLSIAAVASFSAAFAVAIVGFGYRVDGVEFSPTTFESRSFREYACGPLHVCTFELGHEDDLPVYLTENGYVDANPGEAEWWKYAYEVRSPLYLGCGFGGPFPLDDETERRFLDWSRRYPDLADEFWPKAIDWTRRLRDVFVEELIDGFFLPDEPTTVDEVLLRFKRTEEYIRRDWGGPMVRQ